MNKRRERALEVFLYITFPIALFAGCTGLGNKQNQVGSPYEYPVSVYGTEYSQDDTYDGDFPVGRFYNTSRSDNVAAPSKDSGKEAAATGLTENLPLQAVFNFKTGATRVKTSDLQVLSKHAKFLAAHPGLLLSVMGYGDRRGTADYKRHLSNKRAQQVYKILISNGAPKQQLIVDANGDSASVDERGDSVNSRRVELVYSNALMVNSRL